MPRLKKMKSLALDPQLIQRVKDWIAKQDVPPKETAVYETALREFLDKRERKK